MHRILSNKAEALEFNIRQNSPVSDIPLEKLNLKENVLIACINRNGKIITPRGKDVILSGDTVIVVTTETGFKDISDILKALVIKDIPVINYSKAVGNLEDVFIQITADADDEEVS